MHQTYFGEHIFGKNEILENERRETDIQRRRKRGKRNNRKKERNIETKKEKKKEKKKERKADIL